MKNLFSTALVVLTAIGLVGCSAKRSQCAGKKAEVKLLAKSGSKVKGTLSLEDHYGGVNITGKISGLKANAQHGFHVHAIGDCSGRDAAAAGDHFSFEGQSHGSSGKSKSHAGDLGNITADKDGNADVNVHAKKLSLKAGDRSIAGLSLVVHADADDEVSQPAGNSGPRIACGVIQVAKSQCTDGGCCAKSGCACEKCKAGQCGDCKKCGCEKCKAGQCKDCKKCEKCQKSNCKDCKKGQKS